MMRLPGDKKVYIVRRLLAQALGRKTAGLLVTTRCGNPLCMAEDHVVCWTRKQLQARSGKKYAGSASRAAKLIAASESWATLSREKAKEIRSKEMTPQQVMEVYGVSKAAAYSVVAGRTWKDYSSPFAGLMR